MDRRTEGTRPDPTLTLTKGEGRRGRPRPTLPTFDYGGDEHRGPEIPQREEDLESEQTDSGPEVGSSRTSIKREEKQVPLCFLLPSPDS